MRQTPQTSSIDVDLPSSAADFGRAVFTDASHRRVRDVDDQTLDVLLQDLTRLRAFKWVLASVALAIGYRWAEPQHADSFRVDGKWEWLMASGQFVAGLLVGVVAFACSSYAIRRLFVRQAVEYGTSRAAAVLILVRAERAARLIPPWIQGETRLHRLHGAVRDPDTADDAARAAMHIKPASPIASPARPSGH